MGGRSRLDDGSVDVYFIPKWVDEDLEEFSIDQQEQLKAGRVVKADLGKEGRCFVQFDEVINQVMAVPVEIINQNISILTRTLFLSAFPTLTRPCWRTAASLRWKSTTRTSVQAST